MSRYAAVDIGSNTIRMDVAEVTPGRLPQLVSTDKNVARLGESVFRTGALSSDSMSVACGILKRLSGFRAPVSRAVGTAAVREASNREEFVERASAALGVPIEVISGEEEARLIQSGVRSHMRDLCEKPLIIDVGGGSAEIIFGPRVWSLPLGALRLQKLFLHHDPPLPDELTALFRFIAEKAAPAITELSGAHIEQVVGTSATARIVAPTKVREFFARLVSLDLAGRQGIESIGPQRAEIIIPGAAVLLYILETLRLPGLTYSPAALCAGIIADLSASGT